ncbi:bifunctional PIG-L family deacetylase/class I SAM-dependent methyltransferase [Arthrobacter roseus]|uniref:bifunctional PIG-L family deacetylase/class I SAM-dependent methyltransferase n=1 Tax=Arthrobacter roseus TaxID=136274 RepID=UPI001966B747|nr:bifunctional PIG-L family deacetylase/class I SAM-dependent methyltransferase [Arthrobacter roseus]MBM7848162.1 LmbE family N-acetylglucosaminyl deacetylase [Arthrobacter roseus]
MVTFTHDQETTAEADWLKSPRISGMLALDIDWTSVEKLIVVAAHPDDETLGAAGLLQRATSHNVAIDVIVATLGENSHPFSPTHTPKQLAVRRAVEFEDAVTVLAPLAHHRVLDLPDGQLAEHFSQLEHELTAAAGVGGTSTVIVAPWSADGHTDHDAVGAAAAKAAAATGSVLLEYPIWWWHWGSPTDDRMAWPALRKLELRENEQTLKAVAISKHTTQMSPLSDAVGDETLLSSALISHFERSFETFIDMAGYFTQAGTDTPDWICTQFDAVHLDGAEPWDPESWYERRKRALLLGALPRDRYRAALELGCSTGALTAELAPRCEQISGVDASAEAVATATKRLADVSNAGVSLSTLGRDWPQGRFDLYVLSETGYYLTAAGLEEVVARMVTSALPDAFLVACHWRHPIDGWPLGGDDVHRLLRANERLTLRGAYAEEDFLLEVFQVQESL